MSRDVITGVNHTVTSSVVLDQEDVTPILRSTSQCYESPMHKKNSLYGNQQVFLRGIAPDGGEHKSGSTADNRLSVSLINTPYLSPRRLSDVN